MRRLRMLAIPVTLLAGGQAIFGAAPDDLSPPARAEAPAPSQAVEAPPRASDAVPAPSKLPEPPEPPRKYLEAGIRLFNKGKYELAAKYLGASHTYRDRLTANERVVLDVYQDRLTRHQRDLQVAAAAPPVAEGPPAGNAVGAAKDDGVVAASTAGSPPPGGRDPARPLTPDTPGPGSLAEPAAPARDLPELRKARATETWRDPADTKQKARWMLQVAREQIFRGQYDAAIRTIAEVQGMSVRWGYFDDTPAKVSETLAKAREKSPKGPAGDPDTSLNQPHDRRTARARLHEARALLAAGDLKTAESIALAVRSWDLRYGLFDDTPSKVVSAVDEARRRGSARADEPTLRSYLGGLMSRRPEAPPGDTPSAPIGPAADSPSPR